jgi:hypothetical protein
LRPASDFLPIPRAFSRARHFLSPKVAALQKLPTQVLAGAEFDQPQLRSNSRWRGKLQCVSPSTLHKTFVAVDAYQNGSAGMPAASELPDLCASLPSIWAMIAQIF